jgi:hypothetical protein
VPRIGDRRKVKSRGIGSLDASHDDGDDKSQPETESNSGNEAPVRRRRLMKPPTKTENEEILDELDDLRDDSPVADSTSKSRECAKERRRTLEKMRKARLGEISDESGLDVAKYEDETEDDFPLLGRPAPDDDDGASDDFVEEDDDSASAVELPFEFSNAVAASAKDMFDDMVRWMVHLILRDVVLEDNLYTLAHDKIQRQLMTWGESFRSSIWLPEFLDVMLARPEIHARGLPEIRRLSEGSARGDHCEGCNRQDTYSTMEVSFSGNPYDPITLRDLDQEPGEPLVDKHGRELRDSGFVLGKTCFHNAMLAHPLEHWKVRLKKIVREYLEVEITRPKIEERESWPDDDKARHADDVADELIESGLASQIWDRFKQSTSQAWHKRYYKLNVSE